MYICLLFKTNIHTKKLNPLQFFFFTYNTNRYEVNWGDGHYDTGTLKDFGPFGPIKHSYKDHYYCGKQVKITVTYCHNSMNYVTDCCDQFVEYIVTEPGTY